MHPSIHARQTPEKPAYRMAGSDLTVSYRQLERRLETGWTTRCRLGSRVGGASSSSR